MSDVIIGKGNLAGKGVYTNRDFKKDEVVIQYHLKPLTFEEYKNLLKEEKMFTHTHNGQIYLYSEPERYVNHSFKGNVYQNLKKQCDIALHDIKKGEFITGDATYDDTPLFKQVDAVLICKHKKAPPCGGVPKTIYTLTNASPFVNLAKFSR